MSVTSFLDTSVLVYAIDTDLTQQTRRDRARALVREDRFGTSAQVVQEFYVTVTRRIARPLKPELAARWVDRLTRLPFVPTDAQLLKSAIVRAEAWKLSYWDAAIVSAAAALGATRLYTENLTDGHNYGGVQIVNPFK